MSELKACPFCGDDEPKVRDVGNMRIVECMNCSALGGAVNEDASDGESVWNTRPTEEAQQADIAELLEALGQALLWTDEENDVGEWRENARATIAKHEARDA